MNKLLITVVVPLFNKERYIRRCLDSLLNQSYPDFRVIVVNDGSTDGGPQIVKASKDSRVRLVNQSNGGVSAARNRGIDEAQTEWISFLDADDEYAPTFLERIVTEIREKPHVDLVYGRSFFSSSAQDAIPRQSGGFPFEVRNYFSAVISGRSPEIHSSCVAVRRTVVRNVGLFPVGVRVGEDSDMWFRIGCRGVSMVHIPEYLAIYHTEAGDSDWQRCSSLDAYWTKTYEKWKLHEKICARLRPSAEAYYQRYLLERCLFRAVQGSRMDALLELRRVNFLLAPKRYAFKTLLYVAFPIAQLKKRITAR